MPSARTWRRAAVVGGLGLAGVYAFEAAQYHRTAGKGFELEDPPAPGTPDFARMVEALTVAPLRQGNRVTVLRNGPRSSRPCWRRSARPSGPSTSPPTSTGRAASPPSSPRPWPSGPRPGSRSTCCWTPWARPRWTALIDRLEDAGAKVAWFRPPKWYTLHKLNNRTHRKILVVDGRVGFTGGVGIAEEWTGNCEDPGHWRDTHVRVEGPAARDLFGGFLDNWAEATQCILSGPDHLPDIDGFDDGVQVQVTRSTAEKGSTDAEHLFYAAIACARERIWLTTAYFAPGGRSSRPSARRSGAGSTCGCSPTAPTSTSRSSARPGTARMSGCWSAGADLRVPADHAPRQGDDRGRQLGDRVDQLRQPLVRPQRRAQPVAARPGVVAGLEKHFLADLDDARELDLAAWRSRPVRLRAKELASAAVRREL